ncbi:MAG: tRNA (adenosine(37)-N6)-threonylcarbamoyltransferase complex dimerization subunit type 1 TsaB [Firmicutes bacterium]|nr:tRNA (adenosine(37)-N6)-threonylcarbamoyltransferase complex dimerization subunit type 1 TsaB [Bacillota bacterium]
MKILGIEAAAKVAGAAVYENGKILAEEFTDGALTHSETLMPMIDRVLQKAKVRMEEIELITLTNGPGSFTGLRIGAATAKGLALSGARMDEEGNMTGGIMVLPLPTLEVLTFGAISFVQEKTSWIGKAPLLVGTMDARRHQVYTAAYDMDLKQVIAPQALPPDVLAGKLKELGRPCLFLGDASALYQDVFSDILGELFVLAPEEIRGLRAGTTCRLAERKIREAVDAGEPMPFIHGWEMRIEYLRKPQAEREREERLRREKAAEEGRDTAGEPGK